MESFRSVEAAATVAGYQCPALGVEASAGQRATTKTRRIEIRITEEEHNLEQAAATVSGETLSEFVRRAARYEAERTLAEHTRYTLDDGAAQRFLTALE